jgi:Thiamine monophosphate synthase
MSEEPEPYFVKKQEIDYSLYLVADRSFCPPDRFLNQIEQAVLGGVSIVQLREENAGSLEFYNLAKQVSALLKNHRSTVGRKIPFLINGRLDIALAVDCDGLHIGPGDLPVDVCRRLLGKDKILGVSVNSVEEALQAEKNGADYLFVGVFEMGAKPESDEFCLFLEIKKAVSIPVAVIGGASVDTLSLLLGLGIDGIVVDVDMGVKILRECWKINQDCFM